MKSLFAWVLVLGLTGTLVFGYRHFNQHAKAFAYTQDLTALQQRFAQRTQTLPFLPAESYNSAVHALLEEYARDLITLSRVHAQYYNPMREQALSVTEEAEGRLTPAQAAARSERISFALRSFDNIMEGTYKPLASASDKNMRLDITSIQPVQNGTTRLLKVEYVRWGAFNNLHYNKVQGDIRIQAAKGAADAAQILAEDQPPTLQLNPQRWVKEFIPGVEIGYYELPLFPSNAEGVTLSFDFTENTGANTPLSFHLAFAEIPVEQPWKLSANTHWEAQEHIATQQP